MRMNNSSKEHTDLGNPAAGELESQVAPDTMGGDAFEGVEIVAAPQQPNPEGVHEGRRSGAGSTLSTSLRAASGREMAAAAAPWVRPKTPKSPLPANNSSGDTS